MRKTGIKGLDHTQALLRCLRSSPLLVNHLPEAVCFDRDKLSYEVKTPDLNYSQKLGHLYEDALECLIAHSPKINLLGKSIQIFDENRLTLGELDYVLKDLITGEFIHLELAVKFYLIRYQDGEVFYPGPDPRDNWINKLRRLREHQLKLTENLAAKKLLLDHYNISEISSQQLIYGKLFDHYQTYHHPCPPSMNPECERGVWKFLSEWLKDSTPGLITIVPKHLGAVAYDSDLVSDLAHVTREEFILEATQRCTMIWDEVSNSSQFIAPDHWS